MVVGTDLEWHLTGGANNANPFLSLGGEMSIVKITEGKVSNLWDPVSQLQQTEGSTEYRWVVVLNKGQETYRNPHFYFVPKDEFVDIEFSRRPVGTAVTLLDTEDQRPPEGEIGPEIDFPMPFTKSTEDYRTTQSISPDIPPDGKLYICIRREIPQDTPSINDKGYVLVGEGDPA